MAENDKQSLDILKEKRKQRAKERLNSLNSGDITRGLTSAVKDRSVVNDTYSTQKAKVALETKQKSNASSAKNKTKTTVSKTTKNTTTAPKTEEDSQLTGKKKKSKQQIGNIVVDETALENITTVASERRSGRNRVLISILTVLILLIWGAVIIALLVRPKREKPNCFIYMAGTGFENDICEVLMNGKRRNSWRAPEGLAIGSKYTFNLDLKIKDTGNYTILFRVELKNEKTTLNDVLSVIPPIYTEEVYQGESWLYMTDIEGNQTITLLDELVIAIDYSNELLAQLDDDNATLNFYVMIFKDYDPITGEGDGMGGYPGGDIPGYDPDDIPGYDPDDIPGYDPDYVPELPPGFDSWEDYYNYIIQQGGMG